MTAVESHGFGGTPIAAEDGVQFGITETGFNTLSAAYYGYTASPHTFASSNWPQGTTMPGYSNMYITEVNAQQEGYNVYKFTVQCKGLLGLQSVKRTITTRSQSYTTGPITIPGGGAVSQAQGIYINLSCTFHYVSAFLPILSTEPQDAVPPPGASLPAPPANPFTPVASITTPIYNYPYGWLREGIDIDPASNAEMYMIREDWVYKYEYMPG